MSDTSTLQSEKSFQAPAAYNIVYRDRRWTVSVNHHELGCFDSEDRALQMAIEAAHEAGRYNQIGAQVVLYPMGAQPRVMWTYGRDRVPPSRPAPKRRP